MIGASLRLRQLISGRVSLIKALHTGAFVPSRCAPMASLRLNDSNRIAKCPPSLVNNRLTSVRFLNTTDKKKEHHHIDVYDPEYVNVKKPKGPQTAKEFADVSSQKNWISYGFDEVDPVEDRHQMNFAFFAFITIGCITFSYCIYYFPDYVLNDWALREAYLRIDECERLNPPYGFINPDVCNPADFELPTEEEIGDFEIYL